MTDQDHPARLDRRAFVIRSGMIAAGAIGASLLQACTPAAPSPSAPAPAGGASGGAATGSALKLPTYVPFEGPKPDLPGNATGLDPAFFKFPTDLVKTVTTPPGDGSAISAITYLTLAPPPPMEQNVAWQAVNKAVNATLRMDQVTAADYPAKVNVVVAGNDLPDFIYNPTTNVPWGVISGLPAFVKAKCADLTPYLAGDAIKDYPNLAHYNNYTWRSGVIDGKIYALPIQRPPVGPTLMYRQDLFEKAGLQVDKAPKNADDFKRMLVALTRPQDNQWGIAGSALSFFWTTPNNALSSMFRVPNNWRLDAGGKLLKDIETEEFKAYVGWARDLWAAGVWHPNTPQYGGAFNDDFMAGRFAVAPGVWGQYVQLWDIEALRNPAARIYPMHPFAHDGGKPIYHAGSGQFGVTYLKQSSPERLKMLLRVANYFAAPFGSQEWLLNYFGVKETDFNFNADGAPVLTDQGRTELTAVWRYVSSPAYALFSANRSQEFAQVSHAAEMAMIAAMEVDPTLGLYSTTAAAQGPLVQDGVLSGVSDIVQGRRPLSDMDGLVSEWKTKAGDKMRAEFQDAIAAAAKA
jgi:putative aldouronate transport system substrate-binding protein